MRVLVACEFSGIVREAFARRGHDAWSCDLLPTEIPGQHYQGDVRRYIHGDYWNLIIAHPPCTRLCNSGVRWLEERDLWEDMRNGAEFFRYFINLPGKVAIENPIPHKYALAIIGRKYDQIVHPYWFGHGETKATCLWLNGLPKLTPTDIVTGYNLIGRVHKEPPGPDRWKNRSRTYQGIAEAMAEQWGSLDVPTAHPAPQEEK